MLSSTPTEASIGTTACPSEYPRHHRYFSGPCMEGILRGIPHVCVYIDDILVTCRGNQPRAPGDPG